MSSRYLHFFDVTPKGRKTKIIRVDSVNRGSQLGVIKWYSGWRQYTFFPEEGSIWNPECLEAVNTEIRRLMEERKS